MTGFLHETCGPRPLVGGHDAGALILLQAIATGRLEPERLVLMPNPMHHKPERQGLERLVSLGVRGAAVPGLDRALSHGARLAFRPAMGEKLTERGNPAARDLVRHAFQGVGGNANRARSWSKAARRWPAGAQSDLLDAYRLMRVADAAPVGGRGPAVPARDRRGGDRPAARRPAPRARRLRLPDGLRRPCRTGQGAGCLLRLTRYRHGPMYELERPPVCSVGRAMEILGERWTMLIMREAFYGVRRFSDMQRNLGIARNILSTRLQTLVRAGILERRRYQAEPERFEYRLTRAGRDLYPAVIAIMRWGDEHLSQAGAPVVLRHSLRRGGRPGPGLRSLRRAAAPARRDARAGPGRHASRRTRRLGARRRLRARRPDRVGDRPQRPDRQHAGEADEPPLQRLGARRVAGDRDRREQRARRRSPTRARPCGTRATRGPRERGRGAAASAAAGRRRSGGRSGRRPS